MGITDMVQQAFQKLIEWLMKPLSGACQSLLLGAFNGLGSSISNDFWNIAITSANRIGWIMGFVNMALCIVGALHGAARGSVAEVVKSFAMAVLAWPLTAISISVMIILDGLTGVLTTKILTVPLAGSTDGILGQAYGDTVVSNLISVMVHELGSAMLLLQIIVYPIILIAILALCGMLAARQITLILLASVAPIPLMMTGWKTTRSAATKWFSSVLGTLLAAPLSALVIMIGSGMCYSASKMSVFEDSFFPSIMGIAALFMACFSPKMIMPIISFVGNNVGADMQAAGGKVGPNAIKQGVEIARQVVSLGAGIAAGAATGGAATAAQGASMMASGRMTEAGNMLGKLQAAAKGGGEGETGSDGFNEKTTPTSAADAKSTAASATGTGGGDGTPASARDGMDGTGTSQAIHDMAGAGADDKDADGGSSNGSDGSTTTVTPAPNPSPDIPVIPGAPGGQGGQGGEGGSGGQGGEGGIGGQGGEGPEVPAAPAGGESHGSGSTDSTTTVVAPPAPSGGATASPSGPTVG